MLAFTRPTAQIRSRYVTYSPSRLQDALSGHPGHLTPEQTQILEKVSLATMNARLRCRPGPVLRPQALTLPPLPQFKTELAAEGYYNPEKHDDPALLRFLRARKFDIPKAKIMWIDTQKWKVAFKVDELYETFEYTERAEVSKLYPKFYHKCDKDGRPLYVEQLGKLDLTKLYQITTPERQLQALVVEYEKFQRDRLPVCSEIAGHLIETSCTIMDLKGVGITQFWKVKNFVQDAASISQNNYPESMGKFYIINAPWAFSGVWNLIKGWLDEATVAKIFILSSDYKKQLLQQIPADSLPAFLGGTCNCPGGCELSDAGPWQGRTGSSIKSRKNEIEKAQHDVSVESGNGAPAIGAPTNGAVVN
ncbi:hypothetical protein P7C70_g273, partial [Phenoliferia sp. Uapishka_3]